MLTETPELDKLRMEACRTADETEFLYCYRTYRRKGGLRKLVFYPKRKIRETYSKVFRVGRNGKKSYTFYRNQISAEFIADCKELRDNGMRHDDIALTLLKNFGHVKESSVKYACTL